MSEEKKENELELDLFLKSLDEQAKEQFSDRFYKVLVRVVRYLSDVGLTLKEACLLVQMDYDKFLLLMRKAPVINQMIEMKTLEYKRDLLKTLSKQAKGGDKGMAQWLLELKFPGEFGKRKPGGEAARNENEEAFNRAMDVVKRGTDSVPIVKASSGMGEQNKTDGEITADLDKYLN